MSEKKRYAQIGLGGRSMMYSQAVVETFAADCEMVGFSDINEGRLKMRLGWAKEKGCNAKGYPAADFKKMIAETKPDVVIVTTKDCFHDEFICQAMELGCDVITEKPMTIDEKKCQRIIDIQKKTGRKCTVTFNYRYSPPRTQVKDLLMSGAIGEVLSVDFHWLLNTHHGADYFRRWHRNKENSGGLMVHKATHHFDLVNWWLSSVPKSVFAMGHRHYYTPEMADRFGLTRRSDRCLTCPEAKNCSFYLDLRDGGELNHLYLDNEKYDGYHRDQCIFSDKIDIEDSMNVVVEYESGVKMSYSLNAFCPWEGYMVAFNGSMGRLEHFCQETAYINGDGSVPGEIVAEQTTVKVFPHFKTAHTEKLWTGTGGHGGGDPVLLADIFSSNPPKDKYLRKADQRSGAYSILTGVAANKSMASGQKIVIDDLVKGIGLPDYPAMPDPKAKLVMNKCEVKLVGGDEAFEMKLKQKK
jgi:predicted dehydrogenase